MSDELFVCPLCGGDGKETCDNPDHGFISAIGGETYRLGCPVCGHNENRKIRNGGPCEVCSGTGKVTAKEGKDYAGDDWDPVPSPTTPETTVPPQPAD